MNNIGTIINSMISYYASDARRINHFLKVYGFTKTIGEAEGLDKYTQEILEISAITHDIGIKNSELKYNSSAGNYQQTEGPPEAKKLLSELYINDKIIDRVCWLIAHHHTYTNIVGIDYQILVEADFLVNAFEDDLSLASIKSARDKIFKTKTGTRLLDTVYKL